MWNKPRAHDLDQSLPLLAECLILVLVAGGSLGLGCWEAMQGDALAGYVLHNGLSGIVQNEAVLALGLGVLLCAAVTLLVSLCAVAGRRLALAQRFARLLSPLALTGLVPLCLTWQLARERPLVAASLLALLVLAARGLFELALNSAGSDALAGSPWERTETWRMRLEHWRLRSAGLHELAALGVVMLGACAYAVYFAHYTIVNHHNLGTGSFDLGLLDNMAWQAVHHPSWHMPSSPYMGPDSPHLPRHAKFIIFVLAPIYSLAQRAETLLWIQAVILGAAAIPLHLLARRHVGAWPACVIALGYLLYPPLHGANLYDFHCLTLAPFFVWWAVYLLEARRDVLAVLAVGLALAVREDVAAGLIIVGAYLVLTRERPRAGLVVAAVSGAYFAWMKFIVMPGGDPNAASFAEMYQGLVPKGQGGYGAVLRTVATNPGFTLGTLLTHDKPLFMLQIAAPLAFLPWLRPVGLLCSLPGFLFCLLETNTPALVEISFQYTQHFTTYLFLALIRNVAWLERPGATSAQRPLARKHAALASYALAILLGSYQFGAVFQHHTARGGFGYFGFDTSPGQAADYKLVHELIRRMPADAKVVASENIVPQLSNRRYAYTLRVGLADAQYLLYSRYTLMEERKRIVQALKSGDFGVIETRGRFVLAKRGYDTKANAAALAALP